MSSTLETLRNSSLDFLITLYLNSSYSCLKHPILSRNILHSIWKRSNCLLLTHVCSLSSVKSIIYCLFSILKSTLYTIIFISITCKYIPYHILLQNNQSPLLSQVLFWFPKSAISLKPVSIPTAAAAKKSQRVITERGGCSRSAVSKHIKCKVDWKEEIGLENVHKQQGWPASLRILSSKADSNSWESFTRSELKLVIKSHHAQTSSGEGLPNHFWNRNIVRSILPGLRRKKLDYCSVVQSPLFRWK